MTGPLTDVKVLDFSTMVSGSVAARMLAAIFDEESVNIERAAPLLNKDGKQILEESGYSTDKIEELRRLKAMY